MCEIARRCAGGAKKTPMLQRPSCEVEPNGSAEASASEPRCAMTDECTKSLSIAIERLRGLTTTGGEEFTSPETLAAAFRNIMGDPDRLLLFVDTVNRLLYATRTLGPKSAVRVA